MNWWIKFNNWSAGKWNYIHLTAELLRDGKISERCPCPLKYRYRRSSGMPFCTGICTPTCGLPLLLHIHTADAGVEKLSPSSNSGALSRLSPFPLAFFSLLFISPSSLLVSLSHFLLSSLSTHWWFIKAYSPLMISYGVVVWKATWVFLTPFRKSSTLKFSQGKHLTETK